MRPTLMNIRYMWSCNTLNDLSNKVCVPNKTEDLNIHVFNIITGIIDLNIDLTEKSRAL